MMVMPLDDVVFFFFGLCTTANRCSHHMILASADSMNATPAVKSSIMLSPAPAAILHCQL